MGKLIVIEGTDSSGKETQTRKLYENLKERGFNVKKITFPNYESPACAPVKMYLAGEFGENAIGGKSLSSLNNVCDRQIRLFQKEWEEFYNNDGIIITDRYTQSNMIHQGSKIENKDEKKKYMDWLIDLEFEKMKIPKPDMVLFINMPFEFAQELMKNRANKITGDKKKDIHEKNPEYMKKSYENACSMAAEQGWREIFCAEKGKLRTIDEISEDILSAVMSEILGG